MAHVSADCGPLHYCDTRCNIPASVLEMQMAASNIDLKSVFHPAEVVLALIHTADHGGDHFQKTNAS